MFDKYLEEMDAKGFYFLGATVFNGLPLKLEPSNLEQYLGKH